MATEGLKDILDTFKRLERAGQIRALRSAANAALNPVLKETRASAPIGSEPHDTYRKGKKVRTVAPGFLSRQIRKKVFVTKDKKKVIGVVRPGSEAWYGSLLEHGWRPGPRSKKVKNLSSKLSKKGSGALSDDQLDKLGDVRKKKIGSKWWSRAVDRSKDKVGDAYAEKMAQAILREWAK